MEEKEKEKEQSVVITIKPNSVKMGVDKKKEKK